jgi:hypothetical protein
MAYNGLTPHAYALGLSKFYLRLASKIDALKNRLVHWHFDMSATHTAPPQTLQDVLHNVLDHVSTLNIKEGLLLSVSNRLKHAFDAVPNTPQVFEHPVNATLIFGGITIHVSKMVNVKTKSKYNAGMDDNVSIHFSIKNNKGMREKVLPQRYGEWFKFIQQLVRLYSPMEMTLIDADQFSSTFTYKDLSATMKELIKVDGDDGDDTDDDEDCCCVVGEAAAAAAATTLLTIDDEEEAGSKAIVLVT